MNNNFIISSFISISIHILFFCIPIKSFFVKEIDIDIVKAPSSLEISMIHQTPSIVVETEKIEEVLTKEKEDVKEETQEKQQKATIPTRTSIGAITEQISSLTINKPPAYPALARIKGWEGEVVLIASIAKDGSVRSVRVLSGSGFYILDSSAVKAVYGWRFRNINKPIEIKIPVKFILTKN